MFRSRLCRDVATPGTLYWDHETGVLVTVLLRTPEHLSYSEYKFVNTPKSEMCIQNLVHGTQGCTPWSTRRTQLNSMIRAIIAVLSTIVVQSCAEEQAAIREGIASKCIGTIALSRVDHLSPA